MCIRDRLGVFGGFLEFDKHAWIALKQISKDLQNTRLSLYQKKDILKKAFEKQRDELSIKRNEFFKKYEKKPEDIDSIKEVLMKAGEIKQKRTEIQNVIEDTIQKINNKEQERKLLTHEIESQKKEHDRLQTLLATIKRDIENNEKEKENSLRLLKQELSLIHI